MKHPDRIRTTAHTGHQHVGETVLFSEYLTASLASNDTLKVAHQQGVRVWTKGASQQVIGVSYVRNPIAQRLVDGVLESTGTCLYRPHLRSQKFHAKHVQGLSSHVF